MLTTIVVTSIGDTVANDGQVTLREAIQAANTDTSVDGSAKGSGADTITFAPSMVVQEIRLSGSEIAITGNLTIAGLGMNQLIVNGMNLSRVFEVTAGAAVKIDGLAITGGNVTQMLDNFGGGVRNAGQLSVTNCNVSGNFAGTGGGIANVGGTLTVADSQLTNNFAGNGGAINNQSGSVTVTGSVIRNNTVVNQGAGFSGDQSSLIMRDCQLMDNIATNSDAAISNHGGPAVITDTSVERCNAQNAGVIGLDGGEITVTNVSVSDCHVGNAGMVDLLNGHGVISGLTITGCTAGNSDAGITFTNGIYEMSNSTLSHNAANGSNGGVAIDPDAQVTIIHCTIASNQASHNASVANSGTLTVINSTIYGNTMSAGAGISSFAGSKLNVVNSTITGNYSPSGAGAGLMFDHADVTLYNSLIVGNTAAANLPGDVEGDTFTDAQFNLIGVSNGATGLNNGVDGNVLGVTASNVFETSLLADNGGPTQTVALKRTGSAIDAGATSLALDANGQPLTTDQRGFPRVRGASVDVGAVEFQLTPNVTASVGAVGINTATLKGSVNAEADAVITGRGFLYSLTSVNSNPTLGGSGVTNLPVAGTTGAFTADAALPAGTYSFVAYAISSGNPIYSSVVSVTTFPNVGQLPGVTVQAIGNQLVITGDNKADQVQVKGDATAREYVVAGVNGTTVNGVLNGSITVSAVDSMQFNLTAGADVYTLDRANLAGSVNIGGGSGNKSILLGLNTANVIAGNVSIDGGAGNDTIYLNQTYVTGSVTILGGRGGSSNQITNAFSSVGGDLSITGAAGYDLVQQTQVSIGGQWVINVGAGNDLISAAQCASIGNATFTSGTGIDTIAIAGVNLHSAVTFDGSAGGGNKTLTLYSSILANTAYMIGGGNNDSISFDNNVAGGVVVGGSGGKDTVAVRTSILDQLFANLENGDDSLEIRYTHVRQAAQANGGAGNDLLRNIGNLFDAGLQQSSFETVQFS